MTVDLIKRIDDGVARVEDLFLGAVHGVIAVSVMLAVVYRYALSSPLIWSEELVVTLFTWMIFIGLAHGFHNREHIWIEAFVTFMPRAMRTIAATISLAATVITCATLAWFGTIEAVGLADGVTPMLGVSVAWSVAALPAGMALSVAHVLVRVLDDGVSRALWRSSGDAIEEGEG